MPADKTISGPAIDPPIDTAQELTAIVDENNNIVGEAPRREMRRQCLPHRASYIFVFNSSGELCIHKRTETKDVYPGFYDVAAGGVVLAGESYEAAAERELAEELGIAGTPLSHCFDFWYEDKDIKVWGRVFSCVWDGPLVLQPEEVERCEFMPVPGVFRLAEVERFTPDGLVALRKYAGA